MCSGNRLLQFATNFLLLMPCRNDAKNKGGGRVYIEENIETNGMEER